MAEEVLRAAHARRLTKGNNHNSVFPHDACVALYLSVDMCVCVCVYTPCMLGYTHTEVLRAAHARRLLRLLGRRRRLSQHAQRREPVNNVLLYSFFLHIHYHLYIFCLSFVFFIFIFWHEPGKVGRTAGVGSLDQAVTQPRTDLDQ